ncbi:MAG TPA: carboxypeptidase regulatory-like domain-containing protein [Myxococcaceae bacterium]|jgi:plastocyanin
MSSPRSRSLAFATAALAVLSLALVFSNCSKKEETPPPPKAEQAAPAKTEGGATAGAPADGAPAPAPAGGGAPAAEPPGKMVAMADKTDKKATPEMPGSPEMRKGSSTLKGEVKLTGTPPEMQPLKRGVDPVCAKKPMNDEQVLSKDGRLQNVVVWVSKGVPPGPVPEKQAKLHQEDCMYRPRVQAVQDGQTLSVHNGDGTLHNVRAVRDGKTLFNKAQIPKGPDIAQAISAGNALQFKCDVHPWMRAYAVVVPNEAYADVTGPEGKFSIDGLAPGDYTVTAWHELYGTKTIPITIESGKATPILLVFDVQDRE